MSLGVLGIVWGAMRLLSIPSLPSPPSPPFLGAFYIRPWVEAMAITNGLLLIVSGWAMMGRHSWTQTLMVPAHLLFGVYAIVGWIAAYTLPSLLSPPFPWAPGPIAFLAFALLSGGIAFFLSSVATTEALSWLPLQTTLVTPLRCEFCGASLDPQTGLCPQCEAMPSIPPEQADPELPYARLIDMDDDTEFWLEPGQKTLIGRGLITNDINLSNPTVSRHHAQIEYREGHFVLTAMNDANGTFVNDALIRQRTLTNGDEVRFGRARFRFLIDRDRVPNLLGCKTGRGQDHHA
jgi:hypothetical protein